MANKQLSETERQYKRWRNIHFALKTAPYPTVLCPFAIELGVNWQTWFLNTDSTSIGLGLAMAIVSTLASIFAIIKRDSETMKKIGPFISVGVAFLMWGAVCLFLASVLNELGKLLIFAGCGILGAAVEDAVDNQVVEEKYLYMKKLMDENGLSKKGEWQVNAEKQARTDMANKYQDTEMLSILNERKVRK